MRESRLVHGQGGVKLVMMKSAVDDQAEGSGDIGTIVAHLYTFWRSIRLRLSLDEIK